MNFQINPLILFSAFIIATGVRSYYYGPSISYYDERSQSESTYGSDHDHDLHHHHHGFQHDDYHRDHRDEDYHQREHRHRDNRHQDIPPYPYFTMRHGGRILSYSRNMRNKFEDVFRYPRRHPAQSYRAPNSNQEAQGGYRSEADSEKTNIQMVPVQYMPANQAVTVEYKFTSDSN